MKVLEVKPSRGEIVETDEHVFNRYTRYGADCWYDVVGESDGPIGKCRDLEAAYQAYRAARREPSWEGKFKKIPLELVTVPPEDSGVYVLYRDRYWGLSSDNCILLYRGRSPQCNKVEAIARGIISGETHIAERVEFIERVWLPHRCED